jgi:hypothetical protein
VGKYPHSFSQVRCSNFARSEDTPLCVVPQAVKVLEHAGKSASAQVRRIFDEDKGGANLADDADHLEPQSAALALEALARAGGADVLARKAARNDVNNSAPWSSVKGADVVPDRERLEDAVVLALREDLSPVRFDLDGADGSPAEELSPEYAAASARE